MTRSAPDSSSPAWRRRWSWSETSSPAKLSKSGPSPEPPPPIARPCRGRRRGRASVGGAVLVEILVVDVDVERAVAARRVALGQTSSSPSSARRLDVRLGRGAAGSSSPPPVVEQRVLLQLLGDEALDLEVGQRQQPDRLLELRRHHQRLALPKVEAGPMPSSSQLIPHASDDEAMASTARSSRRDRGGGHSSSATRSSGLPANRTWPP